MSEYYCQIHCVGTISRPLSVFEILWQRRNRLRRILKRRWNYMYNTVSGASGAKKRGVADKATGASVQELQSGDLVRVRSREEIQATLNKWNQLKGCSFMEEMWPYCNTLQRVEKRIEKFLDERDYLIKKTKGIIILKDVFCQGTKDFGDCDRTCFFFWREEWLEKVDEKAQKATD